MPFRKERHFFMDNKSCENCKYFIKHYTIINGTQLRYLGSGHCRHEDLRYRKGAHKSSRKKPPCDLWEETEITGPVIRERLEKNIEDIKNRLDEIVLILNKK